MKLTIIPTSNLVMLNDVNYFNIDMSWIPQIDGVKIHAVQWHDDHGEIELVTTDPNIEIKELGVFQKAIELWEEKRQEHLEHEKQLELIRLRELDIENSYKKHLEELELQFVENDTIYYNIEDLLREI